jgi:hypothetical protein
MPGSRVQLVGQRITTVLGPLEIALPAGTVLEADPGAVEGSAWYWSPQAGAAVLTISAGAAGMRTAASLLELERSLDNTSVLILRNDAGAAEGEHHLEFLSTATPSRTSTSGR